MLVMSSSLLMSIRTFSDAVPVESRFLALAVDLQRALVADRVRPDEDPVLPGGQAPEDARLHGFLAGEAQVGLEAGQRVGRHRRALLDRDADLVGPVDVAGRRRRQPEPLGLLAGQR